MTTLLTNGLATLRGTWRGWLATRAERRELRQLPAPERQRVLRDLGLSEDDVDHLIANHPGPERLLPRRLAAAGIDAADLRVAEPATMRDLQRTCSRCRDWRHCEADLAAAAGAHATYCPNGDAIESLVAARSSGCPDRR